MSRCEELRWVTNPVKEALEEPLECIEAGVNAVALQVLLQLREELLQYLVMVLLVSEQLWESRDEESWVKKASLEMVSIYMVSLTCAVFVKFYTH